MQEEWRSVVGYEGLYEVSNLGNIKSLKKKNVTSNKILKLSLNKYGYSCTCFIKNKKMKNFLAHRVVAQAFIPNPINKATVNHKNGIKTDNVVTNLEWCTMEENRKHAIDTGLIDIKKGYFSNKKLTEKDIIDIRTSTLRQTDLARKYNVGRSNICLILQRKSWKSIPQTQTNVN